MNFRATYIYPSFIINNKEYTSRVNAILDTMVKDFQADSNTMMVGGGGRTHKGDGLKKLILSGIDKRRPYSREDIAFIGTYQCCHYACVLTDMLQKKGHIIYSPNEKVFRRIA